MEFKISLDDIRFHAFHGVEDFEREFGNEFRVSLSVNLPYVSEMENDELSHTVSYADLYEIVKEVMATPCKLLETVALKIASKIKTTYPQITGGNISIQKLRPPIKEMLGSASVTLNF